MLSLSVDEAWNQWREECCAELGGHWWAANARKSGESLLFACGRCLVRLEEFPVDGLITTPWGSVIPMVEGVCEYCRSPFSRPAVTSGDPVRFCSHAHKERARKKRQEKRKAVRERDAAYRRAEPRLQAGAENARDRAIAACTHQGKMVFENQGDALGKAVRLARKYGRPFRVYPCDPENLDGLWHITARYAVAEFVPFRTQSG